MDFIKMKHVREYIHEHGLQATKDELFEMELNALIRSAIDRSIARSKQMKGKRVLWWHV